MEFIDYLILGIYVVVLLTIATLVSREKAGHQKNTQDYFLASKSLPWWAIGASLIAANISAEQIIGMSGSGFIIGLGIATYEWMAALTLLLVGKYFLPIFLEKKIYTMPQFIEQRYNPQVKTVLAVFWLAVYIFINLTAVLWLGATAISVITGLDITTGLVFLALFAVAYSLYGGLKAVAFTDIIQVVVLVFGGLFLCYITLNMLSEGNGVFSGFGILLDKAPEKFDMILAKEHPNYSDLPGLTVLIGAMWIANLYYWGCNQYIIQRALGAKNLEEAQKGIAFAAGLKILMPIIVVLPGIVAFVMYPELGKTGQSDAAYPTLMNLMPAGIKGLVFAALVAAIVSSLGSMVNSIATIFTMDLYWKRNETKNEDLVKVGRIAGVVGLAIAVIVAKPLLGNFQQAFQYIQEFTGFFSPGIVALFVLGMFYPKFNSQGALWAAIVSFLASLLFKVLPLTEAMPFLDRMGLVFLISVAVGVVVSLTTSEKAKAIDTSKIDFSTAKSFNLSALVITVVLIALYVTWW